MIGNKTNKEKKMRKYIYSLLAFAAIVSFASCSSEDNNIAENGDNTKVMTFTATQEDNAPATRTAISSTNNKAIVWKSGDQISVFDDSKNNQFTLKSGEETNSATFEGSAASANTYTAVYPYQSGATLSGKTVNNVTLKATQTATEGSFDKTTALMMALGNSTNLAFKNAVGYVKVTPNFDCSKIELKAFNNFEKSVVLAGTGKLSYNNGEPTLDLSSAQKKDYAITLEGYILSGKSYYIAVPPVTLKAGWTIKFKATDGKEYSRMGKKDITFTRNKVTDLGTFDNTNDVTYWYNPRGNVTAEQEVDLGLTVIIGTKSYKVIFAKSNLTATGLATNVSDFGDYFAWGAAEPNYKSYTRTVSGTVEVSDSEWKYDKPNGYAYDPTLSKTYGNDEDFVMADDPARKILGGDWQVPTKTIWNALMGAIGTKISSSNGNVEKDGIKGRKITKIGDNETYIFLPHAGWFQSKDYKYDNNFFYWTSTKDSSGAIAMFVFSGKSAYMNLSTTDGRLGMPIRAVRLVAE